jgi:CDP-glucose 4,6-dehydratase
MKCGTQAKLPGKFGTKMNFWEGKSVAVTGATGIVGSWLVKHLLASGAKVTALIFEYNELSELIISGDISRITCVDGDLRDFSSVCQMLDVNSADTVFHLGAQTIVGQALQNPIETLETNIKGTWNLLEACRLRSNQINRVLIASSDKAYGSSKTLPYDETTPLFGEGPYDVSKSCTDLLSQSYFKSYKVPVVIARCGNIFGGGDLNWSRIVPGTIRDLLLGKQPKIRSNGKFLRDYIYVEDAVQAYMRMAESIDTLGVAGEAFNFSREEPISVLEIYRAICSATVGEFVEPEIQNLAQHEIIDQHLSSKKARQRIGWKSEYTLVEGLDLTVSWYRKNLSL